MHLLIGNVHGPSYLKQYFPSIIQKPEYILAVHCTIKILEMER